MRHIVLYVATRWWVWLTIGLLSSMYLWLKMKGPEGEPVTLPIGILIVITWFAFLVAILTATGVIGS
jgi:hypothetical protein